MPTKLNADGSATYSVTLPVPLTVTHDGSTYTAGGSTVAAAAGDLGAWRNHIAELIAISDAVELDAQALAEQAAAELAQALYSADVADLPDPAPFDELDDDDARGYRRRARRLAALGVELKAGAE